MVADLIDQAAYFDIHGGTPYPMALGLPLSYAKAYTQSSVHTQHQKNLEAQQKLDVAVIGRLDALLKGFGALGKTIVSAVVASRPRR